MPPVALPAQGAEEPHQEASERPEDEEPPQGPQDGAQPVLWQLPAGAGLQAPPREAAEHHQAVWAPLSRHPEDAVLREQPAAVELHPEPQDEVPPVLQEPRPEPPQASHPDSQ